MNARFIFCQLIIVCCNMSTTTLLGSDLGSDLDSEKIPTITLSCWNGKRLIPYIFLPRGNSFTQTTGRLCASVTQVPYPQKKHSLIPRLNETLVQAIGNDKHVIQKKMLTVLMKKNELRSTFERLFDEYVALVDEGNTEKVHKLLHFMRNQSLVFEKAMKKNFAHFYTEITTGGDTVLLRAVRSGNADLVKTIIGHGSVLKSINTKYKYAFYQYVAGAKPYGDDTPEQIPLWTAASQGNLPIIKSLVQAIDKEDIPWPLNLNTTFSVPSSTRRDAPYKDQKAMFLHWCGPNYWTALTPMQIAQSRGHHHVVDYLQEAQMEHLQMREVLPISQYGAPGA